MQPGFAETIISAPVCEALLTLRSRKFPGHLFLEQVVYSSTSATEIRLGHFDKLKFGDRPEQFARLLCDALSMRQMAGILIGRLHRKRSGLGNKPDLRQKFAGIL